MKDRLLALLRDRKVVAAMVAAVLGGLGWSLSPDLRESLWQVLQAIVGAAGA